MKAMKTIGEASMAPTHERDTVATRIDAPVQERPRVPEEFDRSLGRIAIQREVGHRLLRSVLDGERRELLEPIVTSMDAAIGAMSADVETLRSNPDLAHMTPEEEREARLNVLSQFAAFEDAADENVWTDHERAELEVARKELHDALAALHFHELDSINPEATREAIDLVTTQQQRGATYGEAAAVIAGRVKRWVDGIVASTTEALRNKTTSERLRGALGRIGASPLPGNLAFGASMVLFGVTVLGAGKAFADVHVTDEGGDLTIRKDGEPPIVLVPLAKFGTERQEAPITSPAFEALRSFDHREHGVNYELDDPEKFHDFVIREKDRAISLLRGEGALENETLESMTPQEIIRVATWIVEWNLRYEDRAFPRTGPSFSQEVVSAISAMPIDTMLMEYKRGVCRHYAALVEKVSEMLFEESGNPGNRNVVVDEVGSEAMNHAYTGVFELLPDGTIRSSFLDATFDDTYHDRDGQRFLSNLDATSGNHPTRQILGQRLCDPRTGTNMSTEARHELMGGVILAAESEGMVEQQDLCLILAQEHLEAAEHATDPAERYRLYQRAFAVARFALKQSAMDRELADLHSEREPMGKKFARELLAKSQLGMIELSPTVQGANDAWNEAYSAYSGKKMPGSDFLKITDAFGSACDRLGDTGRAFFALQMNTGTLDEMRAHAQTENPDRRPDPPNPYFFELIDSPVSTQTAFDNYVSETKTRFAELDVTHKHVNGDVFARMFGGAVILLERADLTDAMRTHITGDVSAARTLLDDLSARAAYVGEDEHAYGRLVELGRIATEQLDAYDRKRAASPLGATGE